MRAFSEAKFKEPIELEDSVLLRSIDNTVEMRVYEPLKYITVNNVAKVYKPKDCGKVRLNLTSVNY